MIPTEGKRRAQYAGSWYEADPAKLSAQLSAYFDKVESDARATSSARVLAIISPHAGYMFSGSTAAFSFAAARDADIKRVFVLGPSHHIALHGVALPMAASFETPLGDLLVDKDVIQNLKSYPLFQMQPEVHRVEHSLEMQLPLIRQAFGEIRIVPLVIGQLGDETEVRLIAEILKGYVQEQDLVVVSSDFTHYGPRYDYQPFSDNIRENIEKLDREAFSFLSKTDVSGWMEFEERTHDTICGFYPCAVLCAMLPADSNASLLKYTTSQDVMPEEKHNSVSYLAISFTGKPWPEDPQRRIPAEEAIRMDDKEKQSLLEIARRSVELFVREKKVFDPEASGIAITPAMKECFGAFVTLYTKAPDGVLPENRVEQLRGCIGSIWPIRPLWQTVIENAVAVCTKDYRFYPVEPAELDGLEIEISVLTPPRRANSFEDIVLGTDGIILSKNDRQSVFLPFVATEFGWDLEQTLTELCVKAGLKPNDWRQGAKFDLFQSISIEEHH